MKISISQILLDAATFRHGRKDYLAMPPDSGSQSSVQVTINLHRDEDGKSVGVNLRLVSDVPDAQYHFDISYLVLFVLDYEGSSEPRVEDLENRLLVTGANMAMPFCRELVANLTSRARFGVVWVAPVDFSQLATKPNEPAAVGAG